MRTHCIKCAQPFKRLPATATRFTFDHLKPGDCCSEAGWKETQISGYCEYCFDEMFADPEEDDPDFYENTAAHHAEQDADGEEWDGGRYDYLDDLYNHDGRDD